MVSRNYWESYMMFQNAISKCNDTDSWSQVSAKDYAILFPIFDFNVSHHTERLCGGSADTMPHSVYGVAFTDGQ